MGFKLLIIGSMYKGYLESFYERHPELEECSYNERIESLLNDSAEYVASYTRTLRLMGIDTDCIIANSSLLQNQWLIENTRPSTDKGDILLQQVSRLNPDILWIENLSFTDCKWLDEVRKRVKSIRLIIAYHCSPISSQIFERFRYVDMVITCTPGIMSEISSRGIKSSLVYHGFDHRLLERVNTQPYCESHDFVFSGSLTTGSRFHGERLILIEKLIKAGINIELFANLEDRKRIGIKKILHAANILLSPFNSDKARKLFPVLEHGVSPVSDYSENLLRRNKPPLYGLEMYKMLANSKVVLNYHIGAAGDYAGNMRMFEVTGTGGCLLTDNKKNLSSLFEIGNEVVTYKSADDCVEKARWLLANETERMKIAYAGQQKTLRAHTVENRCEMIIDLLKKELKCRN